MTGETSTDSVERQTRDFGRAWEVARVFTRLGFTAFGGPAVHVGMMEDEVVTRRGWLDRQHFLDLVAAVNFIPGPNSTELAILLGAYRAGFLGLVVAGVCFITPAVLIILPLAWMYVAYGDTPRMMPVMHGVNAAVLAIVVVALWRFGRTGIRNGFTVVIAVGALLIELAILRWLPGITPEVPVLALAATAGFVRSNLTKEKLPMLNVLPLGFLPLIRDGEFWRMIGTFLKIGGTLFGSGYVLLSYLQSGFVDSHHWLTRQQILDAISVGQFTPGPVLTTATFIGYVLGSGKFGGGIGGGIVGAIGATIAIFLPSFIFTALLGPVLNRIRKSPLARSSLDAMNAAVVSLILLTTMRLAAHALDGYIDILIALATMAALTCTRLNNSCLILLAAGVRLVVR